MYFELLDGWALRMMLEHLLETRSRDPTKPIESSADHASTSPPNIKCAKHPFVWRFIYNKMLNPFPQAGGAYPAHE